MIAISLRVFLASGNFGPIRLGMSRQQVMLAIGLPETWSAQSNMEHAEIWKYGSIEFYFSSGDESLYMIFCDNLAALDGGMSLNLDPWFLSEKVTVDEAESGLQAAGLSYTWENESLADSKRLQLPSGVSLRFYQLASEELFTLSSFAQRSSL